VTREVARQFNQEVEQYRRTLLYFARICDWEEFKERAGRLFDYLEVVEATERERRFFAVFNTILAVLVALVIILFSIDPGTDAAFDRYRRTLVVLCLCAGGFECYFFMNFRWYADMRKACFTRRRQAFIRDIERDFRSFASPSAGTCS
jgi:hypothetical protein